MLGLSLPTSEGKSAYINPCVASELEKVQEVLAVVLLQNLNPKARAPPVDKESSVKTSAQRKNAEFLKSYIGGGTDEEARDTSGRTAPKSFDVLGLLQKFSKIFLDGMMDLRRYLVTANLFL